MAELKPIRTFGGGLAGLTLGLALRQREVPVPVLEEGLRADHPFSPPVARVLPRHALTWRK